MATLISADGGGNWTALATWKNACTGSGASLLALTAAESKTNTTYTYGVAFTVTNAEVVEGFALHLQRSGTTGTLSVALSDDNGTTATREVTVNLSDLPAYYSWVFFKFGSTLTADGGSDYKVGIKLSSGSSGVSIYRGSATTGDWSHLLREDSAPGSLAAGDVFYIVDALTGAGAKTTNTVTMDSVAASITDFGPVTVGFGTLTYGATAATNYYLKVSGDLTVWGGGTLNIGTTGTKMPVDSTAVLEFDPTTDGEFGLIVKDGGTLVGQGNPMTKVWTLLNTNAAVNATSLTTADSTGWKDNDRIVIASTSRTATETEAGALNGDASGTTLTVDGFGGTGGGVAYAHDGSATGGPGSSDIRAEIINLTRNVKIRSSSSTIMTYILIAAAATVDFDYIEIYYIGKTSANRGITVNTTTAGSCSIQYCSIHDAEENGVNVAGASGSITFAWNVCYSLNTLQSASQSAVAIYATSGAHTITDNVFLALWAQTNTQAILIQDAGSTFLRNRIAGCQGSGVTALSILGNEGSPIAWDGNVSHSNVAVGVGFTNLVLAQVTHSGWSVWRNGSYGVNVGGLNTNGFSTFANWTMFGNVTANLLFNSTNIVTLDTCVLNGDASYATTYGIYNTGIAAHLRLKGCSLGVSVAHSTADISSAELIADLYNTTLASTTEVGAITKSLGRIRSHKHDGSATTYKSWYRYGTILSEQTTRHTASGYAWKLTPNSATGKLVFPGPLTFDTFKAAVAASAAVTVTAWVRKDSSYNGNAPRLVLVGGYIGGIAADVVSSLSVAADTWQQLSVSGTPNEAGVIEWYVDCDGTAGNVYVDDMAVSQSGLPSADNLDYVSWGLPLTSPYTLGAAAAGGLLTHPGMSGGMRG
jgi:hypothetical protein